MPTDKVNARNDWIFGCIRNPLADKNLMVQQNVLQMLNKTTKLFKYGNLPKTITVKDLETQLQVNGFAIFKTVNGELYSFTGGLGGEPNPYYLPTKAIIANPALRYNASLTIDEECVVMLNDHYYQGLMPLFSKYANLLAEAELSLKFAIINARVPALVQADNDNTAESAKDFFDKIEKGEKYGVIASNDFFEGIKTQDFYKQTYIKDLIESIQYIKGSWYNEIGLNAAFNMKREAINEAEATLNEDILYPTIDTMLECRKLAVEKINAMFGTEITVDLDSVWKQNRVQEKLALEQKKADVEATQTDPKVEEEVKDSETVGNADRATED